LKDFCMATDPAQGPSEWGSATGPPQPIPELRTVAASQWQLAVGAADEARDAQPARPPTPAIPGYEILEELGRGGTDDAAAQP
jgi:hypothetical protein